MPNAVAARITAQTPIARVRLVVDRRRMYCEMMDRDAMHQNVFYQPARLAPDTHHVSLDVWDAAGAHGRRTWTFCIVAAQPTRVTQRRGTGPWFATWVLNPRNAGVLPA
jgi:hypothetical protein